MTFFSSVLVTGATGFVGKRVLELWPGAIALPPVDLRCAHDLREVLTKILDKNRPQAVLHLASLSSVQASFTHPVATFEVNCLGTVHLLESLRERGWQGRVLCVSTAAVYGEPIHGMTLTEEAPLAPSSPYAASKVAAEVAAQEWGRRSGNPLVIARPFVHSGPGQDKGFFLPSMAQQMKRAPKDSIVTVDVGNLDVYRDFLHVDDVIGAYAELLNPDVEVGVYNLACGQSHRLKDLVTRLGQLSGKSLELRTRAELYRKGGEVPVELSVDKLKAATGWEPKKSLDDLLRELLASSG